MAVTETRIPVLLRSRADQRGAQRIEAEMPARVDGRESITHDLSATGLRFESDRAYAPGERVQVTVDYLLDGHDYPLDCEAEVVHCEPLGQRFVIGARLVAPLSEPPADPLA